MLVSAFRAVWKAGRETHGDTKLLVIGAMAGLASFCFAALFELSFLRQWVVIILFVLLGIITQLTVRTPRKEDEL